jgi:hypothetical protein
MRSRPFTSGSASRVAVAYPPAAVAVGCEGGRDQRTLCARHGTQRFQWVSTGGAGGILPQLPLNYLEKTCTSLCAPVVV